MPASHRASTNREIASDGTVTDTIGVSPDPSKVWLPKSVASGPPLVADSGRTRAAAPVAATVRLPAGAPGVVGAYRTCRTVEAPGASATGSAVSEVYPAPATAAPVTDVGLFVARFVTVTAFVFVVPTGTSPNARLGTDTAVVTASAVPTTWKTNARAVPVPLGVTRNVTDPVHRPRGARRVHGQVERHDRPDADQHRHGARRRGHRTGHVEQGHRRRPVERVRERHRRRGRGRRATSPRSTSVTVGVGSPPPPPPPPPPPQPTNAANTATRASAAPNDRKVRMPNPGPGPPGTQGPPVDPDGGRPGLASPGSRRGTSPTGPGVRRSAVPGERRRGPRRAPPGGSSRTPAPPGRPRGPRAGPRTPPAGASRPWTGRGRCRTR